MKRLEELFLKFQDGDLTPEETAELSGLLEDPKGRRALVEDFFMTHTMRHHFRSTVKSLRSVAGRSEIRPRREFHTGRTIAMVASLLLCAGIGWTLFHSHQAGPAGDSARVRQDIEKLGSENQREREAAYLKLKELGRGAESELQKATLSLDPEVASRAKELLGRLKLQDELPASLRRALPGIEDRLAGASDHQWTQEFLKATELTDRGAPKIPSLPKEDLSALVGRAFRGAQSPQEQTVVADRTEAWGLRLTRFVPAAEAMECLHGPIDADNMVLQELLGVILTRHGVSYVIDGTAQKGRPQEVISMKAVGPATLALRLLLEPRSMDFATLEGLVVITPAGRAWKANGRNTVPPTPEETKKAELCLKDLVSSDAPKQTKAYDDLVTLGTPALGPLMGSLGHLDRKAAERVRSVCRKIATDHKNLWLVDLPSGADLQQLSASQRQLLETRITCETGGTELEDLLKSVGLKCRVKASPPEPLIASVKEETLSSFLKAATRSDGLDYYLEGKTIIIDTADNVRAVVER